MRRLAILPFLFLFQFQATADDKPNVLFIAVDDLNHWVTHLGRNPQAKTPNIDRLAEMGVTFRNAYCAVPACEPSRCAIMSGQRPWVTGGYKNGDEWVNYQPVGEGLSAQFLDAGYRVYGAGKIYHSMEYHPKEWTHYMPKAGLSANGPGVEKYDGYHNGKTHPDLKDEDIMDWHTTNYCIQRLKEKSDKPFFIACGLYKPHLPFVAPRKYYEAFPLDSIQLPPHIDDDLADLQPAGVNMAKPQQDHAKFLKSGRWKAAIQSYLATCAYTDMNVGRLLDALEASPHKDNTVIVLWGDHGWSLGEKEHWRKFALWEEPTRVPFIWVAPGITQPGTSSHRTVDLMSVFPTLCHLAGIPTPEYAAGRNITPLLQDPCKEWNFPAITTHGRGNHAIRTETHRYIRYANGDEELYHNAKDPYEWENLASLPDSSKIKTHLAKWLPKKEKAAKDLAVAVSRLGVAVSGFLRAHARSYMLSSLRDCPCMLTVSHQ